MLNTLKKINILVVSDDGDFSQFLKEKTQAICDICITNTIEKAISESALQKFHLAVINFDTKEFSNEDIISMILQTEDNKNLPVVLTLPVKSADNIHFNLNQYSVDIVYKPLHFQGALNKIFWYKNIIDSINLKKLESSNHLTQKRQKQKAKEESRQLLREELAILATMSHEIRTPVSAIIGFANMLANNDINPPRRAQFVEYIQNSGNTLVQLLDDIIDYAKIETGELVLSKQEVKLNKLLQELKHNTERQIFEASKDVRVTLDISDIDKDVTIITDEIRFKQILTNLLNNAVKYTEKGTITFGYRFLEFNNELYVFVKDTGIGIPENKMEYIFKKFGQIKDKRTVNIRGGGLGLAIVKSLIKLLNGTIAVESEENEGTAFSISIKDIEFKKEKAVSSDAEQQTTKHYNFKDITILVVEDDETNSMFLKELFRTVDANVIQVSDGIDAVEATKNNNNIDLILMDLKLPVMSGFEAVTQIKQINPNIPVVAQTACTMSNERLRCFKAGFDDFMVKPINSDYLFNLIERIISGQVVCLDNPLS